MVSMTKSWSAFRTTGFIRVVMEKGTFLQRAGGDHVDAVERADSAEHHQAVAGWVRRH